MKNNIWEFKIQNIMIEDCYFYHTMNIPKHGTVIGEWDLIVLFLILAFGHRYILGVLMLPTAGFLSIILRLNNLSK